MSELQLTRPLVLGFGVTGRGVTEALLQHDHCPVIIDDRPTEEARAAAEAMGGANSAVRAFLGQPTLQELQHEVNSASVVLPSPGIPASHPVFALAEAAQCPIRSEFDLAAAWDDRPFVSITGTNGKTSVTLLVTEALERSGLRAEAVGNTEVPFVVAIDDPAVAVFVVEASSFRLAHTERFAPQVATWLNFAPDHLDAHADLAEYEESKASIWRELSVDALAIANIDDPTVMAHAPAGARTFGAHRGDWRVDGGSLVGPHGPIVAVGDLQRRQPHDLINAAAVAATADGAGASSDAIAAALAAFNGFPHRVQRVGEWHGVGWFNDSKATVPQATLAAVGGFESVVLIAGGRNKGLDLGELGNAVPPVRYVVATGEAAGEVADIFDALVPVVTAHSMADAVELAAAAARPGDTVLLSPACTSFDWYRGYGARGTDFINLVRERFT